MYNIYTNQSGRVRESYVQKIRAIIRLITFILLFSTMGVRAENTSISISSNLSSASEISGTIVDDHGKALAGATIRIKGTNRFVQSDSKGNFVFKNVTTGSVLQISFIGYNLVEIQVSGNRVLNITLIAKANTLDSVSIVSNGFQQIPKERATGSFVQIDNSLINRSVSTNILDRLNGVTSGLIFTSAPSFRLPGQSAIEIHGRSTLFANAEPLIIVDNFPYAGDLNNINPNDVESITVLKDAAAASAWGTRSGNGVIVITSKKGALNSRAKVSLNANLTIGNKPDLYYSPQLTSSQLIDVQRFLYDKGAYTTAINDGYSTLPAAVEIFRNPTDPNYETKLNALRGYDIRDQLSKYSYQRSINQQYQGSISGGSSSHKYFVSGGYDTNVANSVGNSYDRVTLNVSNTYYFLKNKLELFTNVIYSGTKSETSNPIRFSNPYDQIADSQGNAIPLANTLRLSYAQSAGGGKLLSWLYKPLDEINNNYNTTTSSLTDYRLNLSLGYTIVNGLKASLLYGYEKGNTDRKQLNELESFYTRNLINQYTQINPTTGSVTYPFPMGDILTNQLTNLQSHNGRIQLDYNRRSRKHNFSGIAGSEIREVNSVENHNAYYGYSRETGVNKNGTINYTADNPYSYGSQSGRLTPNTGTSGVVNRFFSYYFNGSYTYDEKYIASLSAREDESNLFGVATNQKGVPLWSAGLAWILNNERFYTSEWLPQLKLRGTFGYTGNVDNSLSAFLTAQSSSAFLNSYNYTYSRIVNPPNPSLRWEKNQNINLGLDFSTKSNVISGSIDFWQKKGIDLIGNSPIAPQTGIVQFKGNSANTLTRGMDVQINSKNLNGPFRWYSTLLYNYSKSKVSSYKVTNGTNLNVVSSNYNNPLEGFPYYSIFSFKYAGLNATGDPQGFLNGTKSINYSGILNSTNRSELIFKGSATPTTFGSLRNTFQYEGFDLSFNISYRLGYYFRRNSLQNASLYSGNYQFGDYESRWMKTGDEISTNVPALIYPGNGQRDDLYTYADVLVEKADNIRLQDMRVGFTFPSKTSFPIKNMNLFMYMNNVGILWRANSKHLDPDSPTGTTVTRSVAFGIKADL